MSRQEVLKAIRQQSEVSVLIVGAGINGIGTFRDLALQGVDVLLVDKSDFCTGASAASSHMVHGGLRYLENAEFRLVKEALHERNRLLQNAPHYVKPLPTTIPIFSWLSGIFNAPLKFLNLRDKPSERGAFIIKIGLMLYDWFTRGQQTLPAHRFTSRIKSLEDRPQLNRDILCTATYYDAWMPYPERICLELVLDAETSNSKARALNYVRLDSAADDTVTLLDEVSGERFDVKPKVVINAAGPWIDFANRAMQQHTRFIGGTKGSHIIVDHPELHVMTRGHEMFFENKDGRICLFFPLLDKVLIGTTDIRIDDPEQVDCTEEEIDYMLELVRKVFPKIKLDRSHIVYHFSGVRPLPSSDASTTGQISRDHSIQVVEADDKLQFPILSLVGGKWTTFRAFSEQTTDAVLKRLRITRQANTRQLPIGGGKDYPRFEAEQAIWINRVQQETGLSGERVKTLFERYGTRAEAIAKYAAAEADEPLHSQGDYSRREIMYLVLNEKIVHLDDLLLRRSLLAMLGFVTGELLHEVAAIMSPLLGWSVDEMQQEIERTAHILQAHHGVTSDKLRLVPQV
ncbi:MAG: glycerol-3-phosphate dehydrogenase/oxidase [Anaerolineae bacterium]|nr:glycerol-3-phosphate dehydrogenase/oxidase [Anaerolineae bacterium]